MRSPRLIVSKTILKGTLSLVEKVKQWSYETLTAYVIYRVPCKKNLESAEEFLYENFIDYEI